MENNTRTISSIQGAGTYDSKFGLLYKFSYDFEDGTNISANHKTQESPFKVGDEVEVIVTGTSGDFTWGKVKRPETEFSAPNSNSSGSSVNRYEDRDARRQELIMSQWAIGQALAWEMNEAPPNKVSVKNAIGLAKQLLSYAKDLENVSFDKKSKEDDIENPFE
tara:strand:- start:309 stop:800 length:492 start_codon:yes stop_codon:yes gene_type:complete